MLNATRPPHMDKHRFNVPRPGFHARRLKKRVVLAAAGVVLSMPVFAIDVITVRTLQARPQTGSCLSSSTELHPGSTSTIVCTSKPVNDSPLSGPAGPEIVAQSVSFPATAPLTPAVQERANPAPPTGNSPRVEQAPAAAGGYRFISYMSGPAGTIGVYTATGMMTALRRVTSAVREYVEMTVTW